MKIQTRGLRFEVTTAGEGDKLALLLHGFPECAYSWRSQIPLLARMGYRVWAPDLRGYGKSDKPEGISEYTIDKLTQDVEASSACPGAPRLERRRAVYSGRPGTNRPASSGGPADAAPLSSTVASASPSVLRPVALLELQSFEPSPRGRDAPRVSPKSIGLVVAVGAFVALQ